MRAHFPTSMASIALIALGVAVGMTALPGSARAADLASEGRPPTVVNAQLARLVAQSRATLSVTPEYVFKARVQERVGGKWQARPRHLLVKFETAPRKVYARWLKGPDSGQEMLYDATHKPDEVYAHKGGLLGIVSLWLPLDSGLIAGQSNHSPKAMGVRSSLDWLADASHQMGADQQPDGWTIGTVATAARGEFGHKWVRASWSGAGQARIVADFETRTKLITQLYIRDAKGQMQGLVVNESWTPKTFPAQAFSADNPDYHF